MTFELYAKAGDTEHPGSCKFCGGTDLVRGGTRKTKSGVKQLWLCNDCLRRFSNTHRHGKHKDPEAVLRGLILYAQGYSFEQVADWLWRKKKLRVSASTLHRWTKEFEVPYLAIRDQNGGETRVVRSWLFTHRGLTYNYQVHLPKLKFCTHEGLKDYLLNLAARVDQREFETGLRPSQLDLFPNPGVYHAEMGKTLLRQGYGGQVSRVALDALRLVKNNRARHQTLEDYFLSCDSNTIAVEVPISFHDKKLGLVAGHLDILQLNNGKLYLLDFKPGAKKEKPEKVITQLTCYARGLSLRCRIPMTEMRCAWFDEQDYFSFRPEWP